MAALDLGTAQADGVSNLGVDPTCLWALAGGADGVAALAGGFVFTPLALGALQPFYSSASAVGLSGFWQLVAGSAAVFQAAGVLGGSYLLAGQCGGSFSAIGSLYGLIAQLAGSAGAVASAGGALDRGPGFAGSAAAVTRWLWPAPLVVAWALGGSAGAACSVAGRLGVALALAGTCEAASSAECVSLYCAVLFAGAAAPAGWERPQLAGAAGGSLAAAARLDVSGAVNVTFAST
jgi:hypothetical protein